MRNPSENKREREVDLEGRLYPFIIGGLIHDSFGVLGALRANIERSENIDDANGRNTTRLIRSIERLEQVLRLIQSLSRPYYKADSRDLFPAMEGIFDIIKIYRETYPHIEYHGDVDPAYAVGGILPLGVTTFYVGELLANASHACADLESARIELTLSRSSDSQVLEFVCSDSGPGLAADLLDTINEGRARPPAHPNRGGYGFYLMTQIALRLAGGIHATNFPNTGKRITVRLHPQEALDE